MVFPRKPDKKEDAIAAILFIFTAIVANFDWDCQGDGSGDRN